MQSSHLDRRRNQQDGRGWQAQPRLKSLTPFSHGYRYVSRSALVGEFRIIAVGTSTGTDPRLVTVGVTLSREATGESDDRLRGKTGHRTDTRAD